MCGVGGVWEGRYKPVVSHAKKVRRARTGCPPAGNRSSVQECPQPGEVLPGCAVRVVCSGVGWGRCGAGGRGKRVREAAPVSRNHFISHHSTAPPPSSRRVRCCT